LATELLSDDIERNMQPEARSAMAAANGEEWLDCFTPYVFRHSPPVVAYIDYDMSLV